MSNDWNDRCFHAIDDSNYFCDVLYGMFYEDDDFVECGTEVNMDIFREFCDHVQSTYQNLFMGADNPCRYMTLVKPLIKLKEIALFPFPIDHEHDILRTFADQVCDAINAIECEISTENQLILLSDLTLGSEYACAVLYNFELDTPEDVWNRIDLFLSENKSKGE